MSLLTLLRNALFGAPATNRRTRVICSDESEMQLLKQSTAASVLVGPVLDSTGAAYTGAAIADFNLTKNGVSAAMAAAATATHDHNGMYVISLTTTNTNTLGRLEVSCNKATYAMPAYRAEVLTAETFDGLVTNAAGATSGVPLVGSSMTLTSAYDLWTADVKVNVDAANVKNEWTCIVSKNGVVQDTLTAVSIRIGHRDGSAFIASTAMTAGSDGITFSKDFTTSNRLTAGEDVAVFITATDSLGAQHACKVIAPITGRDSTA